MATGTNEVNRIIKLAKDLGWTAQPLYPGAYSIYRPNGERSSGVPGLSEDNALYQFVLEFGEKHLFAYQPHKLRKEGI